MIIVKSFKKFIIESISSIESIESIDSICKKYNITNYTINSDGSIDVDGVVYLYYRGLDKLPLKFGNVSNFDCAYNKLTTLEGGPQSVGGNFNCSYNQLTTLKGSPQSVGGIFNCHSNKLTTLKGSPQSVGGHFFCYNNQLTTLEGCPQSVGGHFYCGYNKLINFNGFPEDFENNVYLDGNPVKEIYNLFKNVKCIRWINEFDVIQDGKVVLDRLEEVYHQLGIDIPENIELKNYEII